MTDHETGFDSHVPHPARRYNYWLGGKDNFAADRESGDAIAAIFPSIRIAAIENRRFLGRVVRHLVTDCGIRQFLDIGTGLPTADNTHEVAQGIEPACRIVYVDNDALVLSHARALLTSSPEGHTEYLDADLRNADQIISSDTVTSTLDLTQPVAVLLVAVLHFIDSDDEAASIIRELTGPLAAGSYLAISHATTDLLDAETVAQFAAARFPGSKDITGRSVEQVTTLLDGLDLEPPGIQVVSRWRSEGDGAPPDEEVSVYGALARIPGPAGERKSR